MGGLMLTRILLSLLCSACLLGWQREASVDLGSILPDPGSLPAGCTLARSRSSPPTTGARTVSITSRIGGETNPWIGSDAHSIAQIIDRIDSPYFQTADGPPPDVRSLQAQRRHRAKTVVNGAAAYYVHDDAQIELYGLMFTSEAAATQPIQKPRTPGMTDITSGARRVVLFGDTSECSTAIAAHVRAVLRRR
jgi:hypothetical protein